MMCRRVVKCRDGGGGGKKIHINSEEMKCEEETYLKGNREVKAFACHVGEVHFILT
jgi:hypothetical protein